MTSVSTNTKQIDNEKALHNIGLKGGEENPGSFAVILPGKVRVSKTLITSPEPDMLLNLIQLTLVNPLPQCTDNGGLSRSRMSGRCGPSDIT